MSQTVGIGNNFLSTVRKCNLTAEVHVLRINSIIDFINIMQNYCTSIIDLIKIMHYYSLRKKLNVVECSKVHQR